jgi:type II secretory pathway component PulF
MAKETPDIPQEIQEQFSKTPAERRAEVEAARQVRLDALTPQDRQKVQERIDRIEAVPIDKRSSFMQASRLAMIARSIKTQVEAGMKLDEAMALLNTEETEAVNWLAARLNAGRSV